MKIMMSHMHREKRIAEAWKDLLSVAGRGSIEIWYSSDSRPEGGIPHGNWYQILSEKLAECEALLAIITKNSANRPWILWEMWSCLWARQYDGNYSSGP